jgi:curved DNA-binding protein CbpA
MRLGRDVLKLDLYLELGVPKDSTSDVIQAAYRRLIRLSHPDLNPSDPHAELRTARLNRAASVLLDPGLRDAYDHARREHGQNEQGPRAGARNQATGGSKRRAAWFERARPDTGSEWASGEPAPKAARSQAFEGFELELRGRTGLLLSQLLATLNGLSAQRQRRIAGLLLGLGATLIVSVRPVTLGLGPPYAQQPVTVAVQALLP